jgi:hypothetical protein
MPYSLYIIWLRRASASASDASFISLLQQLADWSRGSSRNVGVAEWLSGVLSQISHERGITTNKTVSNAVMVIRIRSANEENAYTSPPFSDSCLLLFIMKIVLVVQIQTQQKYSVNSIHSWSTKQIGHVCHSYIEYSTVLTACHRTFTCQIRSKLSTVRRRTYAALVHFGTS